MSERLVSGSREIAAPPAAVFAVLADPRRHAEIDGSGSVRGSLSGPARLGLGSKFGMRMHLFGPYLIRNTVVEFEPDRLIAWQHPARVRWRYRLEPVAGGTLVTEEWDARRSWVWPVLRRSKTDRWAYKAIRETLKKLETAATR